MQKVDFFSKARVSARVRLRVRVSFSRCEMTTFDEPDGVQGWESDSRRIFGKGFGPKVCKKWTSFPKLGLALGLGLGLGLAFEGVTCPLLTNQMVSKVGKVIQEEFLEKVLGPKCAKSGLFFKS